jgi:transcriptional regulator with XRE-family HTH domain
MPRLRNPQSSLCTDIYRLRKRARLDQDEVARLCDMPLSSYQWMEQTTRLAPQNEGKIKAAIKRIEKIIALKETK